MRSSTWVASWIVAASIGGMAAYAQSRGPSAAVFFENARLIVGDATAPNELSAFIVRNGAFVAVGKQGELTAPPGAARVDLAGKTVMPAMIDVHTHLGYRKGATFSAENYSRDNVVDQLNRFAFYGVAAVASAGTDRGTVTFRLRDSPPLHGALVRTAGRGLAPPDAGPAPPMRDAPYGVSTEEEARTDVRELAAQKVDFVKIWVDDRNGTVRKLSPVLYRAIIDEAHKHNLRVFAHIATLADAKDLLRSGVDGFLHPVRDRDVDDELLGLLKERPKVFFALTLFAPRLGMYATRPRWLDESLRGRSGSNDEVARLGEFVASRKPEAIAAAREEWTRLARNVARLHAAGVPIALGTDVGGASAGGLFGWAEHIELENMVAAGLTPAQAIVAATSTSAAVLGLDRLGSVAAGKNADFIVLDRSPLQDISNTRRIARVYIRGQEVRRGPGTLPSGRLGQGLGIRD
jgi:imidazolonepropionase-like amidohydrolase